MHFVEALLIAKMWKLDELVKEKQEEMKELPYETLDAQAAFLYTMAHQVVEEVVTVEFEPESSSQVIVRMNNDAHYHLDLDWTLSPEEFVDRIMDQVIVTFAEDLYSKGDSNMKELDWFVNTLQMEFSVEVTKDQIGYEGNELYLDEIDEAIVPVEMMKQLPKSLLFEMMMVEDQEGLEWVGVVAFHPNSREWLLQVILKEGEPVLRKLVGKENGL